MGKPRILYNLADISGHDVGSKIFLFEKHMLSAGIDSGCLLFGGENILQQESPDAPDLRGVGGGRIRRIRYP